MSFLRIAGAAALICLSFTASAYVRYDDTVYEIDTGIYTLDTGEPAGDGGSGVDCFRECNSEYSSCMSTATQDAADYCEHAYEDFRNGDIDRMHYEMIMETCYGMYDADVEICSTTLSMCQNGCDAG